MKKLALFFLLSAILIAGCKEDQSACYCDTDNDTRTTGFDPTAIVTVSKDTQTVMIGNNTTVLTGDYLQFTIPPGNWVDYMWSGSNLSCNFCPNPVSGFGLAQDSAFFEVTLFDTAGNTQTFTSYITVLQDTIDANYMSIYIPNAFTPDGNGWNDYFYVYGQGFNRYHLVIKDGGATVFETFDKDVGWAGVINGSVPDCTNFQYILDVAFNDGTTYHCVGEATLFTSSCPGNIQNCRMGAQFDGSGFDPNLPSEPINC